MSYDVDNNLDQDIEVVEEVLTTDWFPGNQAPTQYGLYEWVKPCHNFWEFPKRPVGKVNWTANGWYHQDGTKVAFNEQEDMWRGLINPV